MVVGGGQAGLAAGYHLRRAGVDFTILDSQDAPGGAWSHMWESLHLFSPAELSSLPGRLMPPQPGKPYPQAAHVVDYPADYERRYGLPVHRPVREVRISGGERTTIQRSPNATGGFRIVHVRQSGSLSLDSVTVRGGDASGTGAGDSGGATTTTVEDSR